MNASKAVLNEGEWGMIQIQAYVYEIGLRRQDIQNKEMNKTQQKRQNAHLSTVITMDIMCDCLYTMAALSLTTVDNSPAWLSSAATKKSKGSTWEIEIER